MFLQSFVNVVTPNLAAVLLRLQRICRRHNFGIRVDFMSPNPENKQPRNSIFSCPRIRKIKILTLFSIRIINFKTYRM